MKISALPPAGALNGSEQVPVNKTGAKRTTVADIAALNTAVGIEGAAVMAAIYAALADDDGASLVGLDGFSLEALLSGRAIDPQTYINNGLSHRDALYAAMQDAAASTHKLLTISSSLRPIYTSFDKVVAWENGVHIVWAGGEIVQSTWGVPALYNCSNFGFQQSTGCARFRWDGTIAAGAPPEISNAFVTDLYTNKGLTGDFNGCRDNIAALLLCGSRFEHNGPMKFSATDFSHVSKLMPCGIAATQGVGSTRGRLIVNGPTFSDGMLMGCQAFNVETIQFGDRYSFRYGQLDLDIYPHNLPTHDFYFAPGPLGIDSITVGNCYDKGLTVAGTDSRWGPNSYKSTSLAGHVAFGNMVSSRPEGSAFIMAQSGTINGIYWKGTDYAKVQPTRAFQVGFIDTAPVSGRKLHVGTIHIDAPDDDQAGVTIGGEGIIVDNFTYRTNATPATLAGIGTLFGNNHVINATFILPNIPYNSYNTSLTFIAGAANNKVTCLWDGPDWNNCRWIEQGGVADYGNTVDITHKASGSIRRIRDNIESFEVFDDQTVALAGAGVNAASSLWPEASMIPQGAMVIGVTSRVGTAITGADGWELGDGATANLYADKALTASGSQSGGADMLLTVPTRSAAHNIRVTAKNANFTAGTLNIRVHYKRDIAGVYNV
jgi:hypothetical protein